MVLWGTANAQLGDVFSDSDSLVDRIGTLVGCDLSARLKADMQVMPLFSNASGTCELQRPVTSGQYFSDPQCARPLQFYRTGQQEFCALAVDKQRLGNGAGIQPGWTLPPGVRYDIGVQSLAGLVQPYRKSITYRSVATDMGECQLEMRIYRNSLIDTDQQNLMPLLAIHGGSWKARGFGTMGIEAAAAHYTAKGFVVFAPFYRLLSDSEPNVECQSTPIEQIIGDAEYALQWVIDNAARYGASGKPVVMGQSAGAHLALSVVVARSAEIAGALLMYPPTDFTDFLNLVLANQYTNEQGLRILGDVLGGGDASLADLNEPPIPQNSFPSRIASTLNQLPPMVIFHGLSDELVPASQSVRLCNALARRPIDEEPESIDGLEQTIPCGPDSKLHLYQLANHALDVCLTGNELLNAVCPAGGRDSQRLIAAAFEQATGDLAVIARNANTNSRNNSGGGVFYIHLLLLLLLAKKCFPNSWTTLFIKQSV